MPSAERKPIKSPEFTKPSPFKSHPQLLAQPNSLSIMSMSSAPMIPLPLKSPGQDSSIPTIGVGGTELSKEMVCENETAFPAQSVADQVRVSV